MELISRYTLQRAEIIKGGCQNMKPVTIPGGGLGKKYSAGFYIVHILNCTP
jgi:hypothetical protein